MRHCGVCGSQDLIRKDIKGSFHPWKTHSKVELLVSMDVLVCQECDNQILTTSDVVKLDRNLQESLKIKVGNSIKYLVKNFGLTQEEIARAIGITPQYMSMLKKGKKVLSSTAFNLLQSYLEHPDLITKLCGIKINTARLGYETIVEGIKKSTLTTTFIVTFDTKMQQPPSKDTSEVFECYSHEKKVHTIELNEYEDTYGKH